MTATDLRLSRSHAPHSPWRDDAARLTLVALIFVNAWLALAHLDPPRPEGAGTQDWHGNVMASAPR